MMNQEWNKGLKLNPDLVQQCSSLKPIDVLVGVLCKDVETTILNVLNVINEGLYRYFPNTVQHNDRLVPDLIDIYKESVIHS